MTSPFVTAICLAFKTRKYVDYWLPKAVKCFESQTYKHGELVIVTDRGILLKSKYPGMFMIHCPPGKSVGHMRNVGLDAVLSGLLAGFDSDDWHGQDRLAQQVAASQEGTKAVTLQRQIRYDFETNCALIHDAGTQTGIHGTLLHPVTEHRYPEIDKGEDTAFLENFRDRLVVLDNNPQLYVRFSHGDNISTRQHIMGPLADKRDVWDLPGDVTDYLKGVLEIYPYTRKLSADVE